MIAIVCIQVAAAVTDEARKESTRHGAPIGKADGFHHVIISRAGVCFVVALQHAA